VGAIALIAVQWIFNNFLRITICSGLTANLLARRQPLYGSIAVNAALDSDGAFPIFMMTMQGQAANVNRSCERDTM
jgi:hypothetical protein